MRGRGGGEEEGERKGERGGGREEEGERRRVRGRGGG